MLFRCLLIVCFSKTHKSLLSTGSPGKICPDITEKNVDCAGLENSTRPLVFTSASGCRASANFDISSENLIFPIYANNFCDAGQVLILRYFEACCDVKNQIKQNKLIIENRNR